MIVKCCTLADAPRIAAFLNQAKTDIDYFSDLPPDIDQATAALAEFAVRPDYFFWLLEYNGNIVGVMIGYITPLWWTRGEIATDLLAYVAPGHRGHGLRLIRSFIRWAKGFDTVRRILLSESTGNDRAAGLYRRLGFAPVAGRQYVMEIDR